MSRTTPVFHTLYKKLNDAQKQAVDAVEGPVMVVAGPGTGKTQILTLRIANILRTTDTPPDAILALTFTESGAIAMKRRLAEIVGPAAYRVHIQTFHGFCNAVIQRFPDDFPRLISSDAISDIDKVLLMRTLIEEAKELEHLRPFYDNFAYTKSIISAISTLKREYVDPTEFAERVAKEERTFQERDDLVHTKGAYKGKMKKDHQRTLRLIERNKELALLYMAYENALKEQRLYDYEDMIGVVVKRLQEDEDVLQRLREEYLYVLADEHQDANAAQNTLLELLVDYHDNPNIFIVGDEKQAIFRFQGASLENFLYFKNKYPEAKLITLVDSYRSGQRILDAAHSVIQAPLKAPLLTGQASVETTEKSDTKSVSARDPLSGSRVQLRSKAAIEHDSVVIRAFNSDEMETYWVADDIEKRIGEGVPPNEIAVLYRNNTDAAGMATALERRGIVHTVESDRNVLDDPAIAQFILLLRTCAEYGNDETLAHVLHARFLEFDPLDVYKLLKHSSRERIPLHDVIRDKKILSTIGLTDAKGIQVFGARLAKWAQAGHNDPVTDVFNRILEESGFLTFALNATRSVEMLEKLSGFARGIEVLAAGKRTYTLPDLIRHLDLLDEYRIPIAKAAGRGERSGGVRLMTAHRSKGLEFDHVYIIGAWDTHWGNKRKSDTFALPLPGSNEEANADERRLFYVALTRARIGISVSYAQIAQSGRERLPSQFIDEMDDIHKEVVDTRSFEEGVSRQSLLGKPVESVAPSIGHVEYLRELFTEQGISVTALNNYLQCPWNYFYSNLIRIPKIPTKYMVLGTVVHRALNVYFAALEKGHNDKDVLLTAFDDALARTALSGSVFEEVSSLGREYLAGWFDAHEGALHTETRTEYRVDTTLPIGLEELPALRIQGILDKIDIHSDGVHVIDYKTGAPKTKNHMLGNTKARGSGDYFRQLAFYKLLLDQEGRFVMKKGVIDFIQPKDNGSYIREEFEVTPEDAEVLRKELARVAGEILTFSFWDARCADHAKGECEYCALRELMR